jgi:glycogen synthase
MVMAEMNYEVELLDSSTFKIFKGVYNDFKSKAVSEYKFELEPLEYEEFISAVENGYLKCIVLKENLIPTAFLVYTSLISEAIELNIIHCLGWFAALLPFYVKRTEYKNNPFFNDSKVVLSLFNDEFQGSLVESFLKKLKAEGGTAKDWKIYKEPTYLNLMKAAISYSDAVVVAQEGVNQELIDFAIASKKQVIEYAPFDEQKEKINALYDSLAVIEEE